MIRGFALACLGLTLSATACTNRPDVEKDGNEVRQVFEKYLQSVNTADVSIAEDVWRRDADTSAVTPFGRFQGWDTIRDAVYLKFLSGAFTQRKLTASNVTTEIVGDTAWVVYDWVFEGTMANGQPMTSKGWESQLQRRTDGRWAIAHLHYSAQLPTP